MSHEPPVPPESTSPYPLQPPPTARAAKRKQPARGRKGKAGDTVTAGEPGTALVVVDRAPADENASAPKSGPIIGMGAAVALGAAAAVTGLLYAKRRQAAAAAQSKRTSSNGARRSTDAPARRKTAAQPKRSGDDKVKRNGADRRRVAADQPYEVTYFARKHGLSAGDARAIIQQAGSDRAKANQLAAQRTGGK